MIHHLSQLLFLALLAAAGVTLLLDRKRAAHMTRLEELLAADVAGAAPQPARRTSALFDRLLPRSIVRNLRQLGFQLRSRDVAAGFAAIILSGACMSLFAGPIAGAGIVAMALLLAWAAVAILAARRVAKFASLLPGFLDRLRQLLAIGSSLPTAFTRAVQGSQPIVAEFLEPAIRRVHNGAGFYDSIRQSADDIDLDEMRLFATTVAANTRFGGSLSLALNNLVLYLRRRAAINRELRANTAQIRASAWVLALLPVVVAGAVMLQNRDYAAWFVTHPAGRKLLLLCLLSQLMGAALMRLIVRTRF